MGIANMITVFDDKKNRSQGRRVDLYQPDEIEDLILSMEGKGVGAPMWSPSLYKPGVAKHGVMHGQRVENYSLKHLWEAAYLLALDVDDGLSMEQAKSKIKNLTHIIATTHSHDPDSGKDKYRVIIWMDGTAKREIDYNYTAKRMSKIFGGDSAPTNGSSRFYGCSDIYSMNPHGDILGWLNAPTIDHKKNEFKGEKGQIPFGVMKLITQDYTRLKCGRPVACYVAGVRCKEASVDFGLALATIMGSDLVKEMLNDSKRNYTATEIERQIENGYRNG
jgi:hypothetical protein